MSSVHKEEGARRSAWRLPPRRDNWADTQRAQTMSHVNKTVAAAGHQYRAKECGQQQRQQNFHNHNQNGINNKSNANTS